MASGDRNEPLFLLPEHEIVSVLVRGRPFSAEVPSSSDEDEDPFDDAPEFIVDLPNRPKLEKLLSRLLADYPTFIEKLCPGVRVEGKEKSVIASGAGSDFNAFMDKQYDRIEIPENAIKEITKTKTYGFVTNDPVPENTEVAGLLSSNDTDLVEKLGILVVASAPLRKMNVETAGILTQLLKKSADKTHEKLARAEALLFLGIVLLESWIIIKAGTALDETEQGLLALLDPDDIGVWSKLDHAHSRRAVLVDSYTRAKGASNPVN